MFEFDSQPISIKKVSLPMEKHGQEDKLGTVLTCIGVFSNSVLSKFGAGLRDSLYRLPTEEENADLATDMTEPCMLRHPRMSPFEWDYESEGYTAVIDHGSGGESDIKLTECKVKKILIEPLDKGLVRIKFNINCHPDDRDIGALGKKQKQEIPMKLTGPAAQTPEQLFDPE